MKKDKIWLKEQLKHEEIELKYAFDNYEPYEKVLIADDVNDLLNQLDEPEKEKLYLVKVDQGTNYLYVESLHLYSDVIEPLDFNYKISTKEHALKFANRNKAKGVAELVDGEVEEVKE